MIIFARLAKYLEGVRAIPIHTDVGIGVDFEDGLLDFLVLLADGEFHKLKID
jgi:hypothetical protein